MNSKESKPSGSHRGWMWSVRHPITLRAVTIAMASLGGIFVTNHFQEQTWVREVQFQIFNHTLEEGFKVVDDISKTTSKRLFGLNRVIWVAKGTGTGNLDQAWEAYYEAVLEWNTSH